MVVLGAKYADGLSNLVFLFFGVALQCHSDQQSSNQGEQFFFDISNFLAI